MSEKEPRTEEGQTFESSMQRGLELLEQDKADPVRGPVVRLAEAVFRMALEQSAQEKNELMDEIAAFRDRLAKAFLEKGEEGGYLHYRLYHAMIGSGPLGDASEFDLPDRTIEKKLRTLAETYGIQEPEV